MDSEADSEADSVAVAVAVALAVVAVVAVAVAVNAPPKTSALHNEFRLYLHSLHMLLHALIYSSWGSD